MLQDDGTSIPFDISVTACIPHSICSAFIQGKRRTWHRGAHRLINSQETCFISGLAATTQMGADYPFDNLEARGSFNYYGNILYGWSFKKAKAAKG